MEDTKETLCDAIGDILGPTTNNRDKDALLVRCLYFLQGAGSGRKVRSDAGKPRKVEAPTLELREPAVRS